MKTKYWLPVLLVLMLVMASTVLADQSPQTPVSGVTFPQFAQPLPLLGTIPVVDGTQPVTIRMCEFWANILPPDALAPGEQPKTRVWGYIPGESCPPAGPDDPALETYIGPVVLATRGITTQTTFINELGWADTTQVLAYKYSTDQTLHWADPLNAEENMCNHMDMYPEPGDECAENYAGPIPAVPHLHGGEVPAELDGGPTAWFTSDGAYQGHEYYTNPNVPVAANGAVYTYPNVQEAASIWFHDHTLGATRLNVYAGLAGAYLLNDPELALPEGLAPYGLDRGGELDLTVPLVIQDRQFDTNGQLFFPAAAAGGIQAALNPEHPYWNPEFLGDTIVVNGKAWPYLNVEPRRYRFLFLNGSNARAYEMFLTNPVTKVDGPALHVIATDGGYLDAPVMIDPNAPKGQLNKLVIMPGERYEVIIDFAGLPEGTTLVLRNVAKAPYPNGGTPDALTTGRILQFRVTACDSGLCGPADTSYDPATGTALRPPMVRLADPSTGQLAGGVTVDKTRQLTLNEVMGMPMTAVDPVTGATIDYPGGPLEVLVNNTIWSGGVDYDYDECEREDFRMVMFNGVATCVSEVPQEGDTEVWEVVNMTADAHPIHLHLVQFQLINRQAFNLKKYDQVYSASFESGSYEPSEGPPLNYDPSDASGGKFGGNPDVTPFLRGPVILPNANEAGWKDTVVMLPGQVTRIAVRWAPTDLPVTAMEADLHFPFDPSGEGNQGYVWHCHIIDHEDNEMMRPDLVDALIGAERTFIKGVDY